MRIRFANQESHKATLMLPSIKDQKEISSVLKKL